MNALGITDYTGTEHEQLIKRLRSAQSVDEALLKSFDALLSLFIFHFVVYDAIQYLHKLLLLIWKFSILYIFRSHILLLNSIPGQLMSCQELLLVPCIRDPQ